MSSISLRRAKRRKLKNEINVVPYIDVMLVLLIIFMVTTPLMNLGTDINLPDSRAKSLGTPKDPVVVSVYPDGQLALMVEQQNTSVTREDLVARLRGIHTQNPEATILVNGDGAASYQRIMNAIDLINEAGISKVSLISRPQEGAN
ncbi:MULTISPECIES: protein TolR [unclassified Luteimonas]|uniref:protein TolR n=1 Tax=unclassified Luteimonas TaxID=2629088 RepID=UPI000B8D2857|nr:protein TolR [Luteimonas sp. S4-F44]ASR42468.1 protein TolR [Xanthomonas citri pv. mangiferaeindicae]UNK41804.1 protein TolR [Luteimonas sp. S4-F44]